MFNAFGHYGVFLLLATLLAPNMALILNLSKFLLNLMDQIQIDANLYVKKQQCFNSAAKPWPMGTLHELLALLDYPRRAFITRVLLTVVTEKIAYLRG